MPETQPFILTLSGPPGSGTTTLAKRLEAHYDLFRVTGGDIFRSMAAEQNMSEQEFGKHVNKNPKLDREIDERLYAMIQTAAGTTPEETEHPSAALNAQNQLRDANGLLVESRLAGWLASDHANFRLWCDAPIEVRANRIQTDRTNRKTETLDELRTRENDEAARYDNFYGININDSSIYDLVINTARWSPDTIFEMVTTGINQHNADTDEGQVSSRDPIKDTTLNDATIVE
ncbi:cytidylate kinase family protein [Salinibaculum rarum]|uniref:cytidylate kinase family protein n=1 Tax=Salinibaculum rarum TaxID=3058903 RepID=UPI00265F06E5|nr:cytidylate kinase family protein [Salinibaculum sp. KK48]